MTVQVHTDFGVFPVEYTDGMTVDQMAQKLFDDRQLENRGGYTVQETQTGHVLNGSDAVVDHRYYYMNGFTLHRNHRTP